MTFHYIVLYIHESSGKMKQIIKFKEIKIL